MSLSKYIITHKLFEALVGLLMVIGAQLITPIKQEA